MKTGFLVKLVFCTLVLGGLEGIATEVDLATSVKNSPDKPKKSEQYSYGLADVITDSKSDNTPRCERANYELVDYKEQSEAIETLIQNLKNKYWQSPASAAVALGMTKNPRAFDALVNALDYPSVSYSKKQGDIEVIPRSGAPPGIVDLVVYGGGPVGCASLHCGIAEGFEKLGDKKAIPYLHRLLIDKEADACMAAANALVQYKDKEAIPLIRSALSKQGEYLIKYAEATMKEDEKKIKELQPQIERARKEDPHRLMSHTKSYEEDRKGHEKQYQEIKNALFDNVGKARKPEEAVKLLVDLKDKSDKEISFYSFNDYPYGYTNIIKTFQKSIQKLEKP